MVLVRIPPNRLLIILDHFVIKFSSFNKIDQL